MTRLRPKVSIASLFEKGYSVVSRYVGSRSHPGPLTDLQGRPKRWISTRVRSIVLDKHGAALLKEFPSLAAMRSYAPNLRRLTMSSNEGTTGTPDARSRRRTKERSEIRWRDAHPSVELRWDEEIPSCFTDVTASEAGREVILAAAQWGMRFPKTFRTSKDGIRVGAVPAQRDVGTLGPIHSLVVGGPDSKPGDDVLADLRLSLTNMSAQIMSLPKRVEIDMNTSDPQDWHQAIHELRRAYSARFPLNSLTLGCSGGGRAPSFGDTVSSGLWSALNFCTNVQVSVRRRKEPEACVTHGVEVPKSIRSIIVDVGDDELDVNAATTLASSIRFRTGKAETSVRFTGANDHSMPFRLANSVMANRL